MKQSKLIIIANYKPDNQQSMLRFADMLEKNLADSFTKIEIWYPYGIFSKIFKNRVNVNKWLAYIDKWIIYPLILKNISRKNENREAIFHIVDHSNSPYRKNLPIAQNIVITCHDVLAIRGGLGYNDAYCESTRIGSYLQKYILKNLLKASKVACVSQFTLNQLNELDSLTTNKSAIRKVIYNCFNNDFTSSNSDENSLEVLKKLNPLLDKGNYLLHVGSSLPRKNRGLLVNMLRDLGDRFDGYICFAGEAIDVELKKIIEENNLSDRIISIKQPSHKELLVLYKMANVFVFPSFSEGFGWPLIEAQACGVPVIASHNDPMPEIGGNGALYADPMNPNNFAKAFFSINADIEKRALVLKKANQNILRFEPLIMKKEYLNLYES